MIDHNLEISIVNIQNEAVILVYLDLHLVYYCIVSKNLCVHSKLCFGWTIYI